MTDSVFEISACEVCGNEKLDPVLNLGNHALCDDLIPIGSNSLTKKYPIEILFCNKCKTAHQKYQVPKKNLFPEEYHYRSRFTSDVIRGMDDLVSSYEHKFDKLSKKNVLDIGCNDGSLLDIFASRGATTFGIEPTNAHIEAKKHHQHIYGDYISEEITLEIYKEFGNMDVITFTNVFAHIENLNEVLCSIANIIGPNTVLIIENHYLGSIIDSNQFDTFYHEHPRSYSYNSFEFIASKLGLDILDVEFPSRYGGNIRVFLGKNKKIISMEQSIKKAILKKEENFYKDLLALQKAVNLWVKVKSKIINDLVKKHGKLPAKAFPGRAAILIELLGINEDLISAAYEKPNSMKVGHYIPGTKIPILSENHFFEKKTQTPIINLAWHISREIQDYLKDKGFSGKVIDILSLDDFNTKNI